MKKENTMNNNNNIILHNVTPEQLKAMLQDLVRSEMERLSAEIQVVIGEDDLISTGTASRLLGVCNKSFRVLASTGHFTVYHHLKERRFSRGEILAYRNSYKEAKRRRLH